MTGSDYGLLGLSALSTVANWAATGAAINYAASREWKSGAKIGALIGLAAGIIGTSLLGVGVAAAGASRPAITKNEVRSQPNSGMRGIYYV